MLIPEPKTVGINTNDETFAFDISFEFHSPVLIVTEQYIKNKGQSRSIGLLVGPVFGKTKMCNLCGFGSCLNGNNVLKP